MQESVTWRTELIDGVKRDVASDILTGAGIGLAAALGRGGKVAKAAKPGTLAYDAATKSWKSPAGLIYGPSFKHGNSLKHVLDHLTPNPSKVKHSVFNCGRAKVIELLDEAWARRGAPLPNDPGTYVIDMGRTIGTGGQTFIKIVVRPGTTDVISAYPFK
jgi:hypothetical protein